MKQGIIPQYWKQEVNGRCLTKATQIFSPLPILTDTIATHLTTKNDQPAFPSIYFNEEIPREIGQEIIQTFSLPYPSNPEAHCQSDRGRYFCLCLVPAWVILWGNFHYPNATRWLLTLWSSL